MNIHYPSTHTISLEDLLKGRAKVIAELIKTEFGNDVPHGQCLKIVSQLFGFKNWNAAKAQLPKEILLDPVGMAKFIRDRDEAVAQRDGVPSDGRSANERAVVDPNPAIAITTVGALRRALGPYDDSTSIDASHTFKLIDVLKNIDEWSLSEDEVVREFSLRFRESDSEEKDCVTLELSPTYETVQRGDFFEGGPL